MTTFRDFSAVYCDLSEALSALFIAGGPGTQARLSKLSGIPDGQLSAWRYGKRVSRANYKKLFPVIEAMQKSIGNARPSAPEARRVPPAANSNGHTPADAAEFVSQAIAAPPAKAGSAPLMKWETYADIMKSPPREYLVDGLMAKGEVSLWVGKQKAGKTFLLHYIAHLHGVGVPKILGRTAHQGRVLYVTAEGGRGLPNRARALAKRYGPTNNVLIHRRSFDLRRDGYVAEIIAKAVEVGASLIIIDTVNRALAGGDENSSKDMGELVRSCDLIKEETGAHVALIHHTPHDRTSSRGHSSLPAACDLVMSVWCDEKTGIRRAMVAEARDIREGAVFPYHLIEVECEADENGEVVTATTIEVLPEEEADRSTGGQRGHTRSPQPDRGAPPTRATDASRAMSLLRARIEERGKFVPDGIGAPSATTGIPEDDFRAAYSASRDDATPSACRQAYRRAMEVMDANHGVRRGDGWLWIDPGVTA